MNITQKILSACTSAFLIVTAYGAGTLSPAGSGLKPAEIISHDVKVTINNGFAQTEVTQQFRNINDSTIEAVYSFPVPQSASLSECQVLVGEKQMEGEVVPKADADRIYKEETAAGNNAAKADKNGYEDFTFKISNLNPQDTATISFTYYQPLPIDTGVCRYAYPLEEGNTRDSAAEATGHATASPQARRQSESSSVPHGLSPQYAPPTARRLQRRKTLTQAPPTSPTNSQTASHATSSSTTA